MRRRLLGMNGSTLAGELPIGASVFFNVNGVSTEFLAVHQGLPTEAYDASYDGTWLLMKDAYIKKRFSASSSTYIGSEIQQYLDNEFLALFDADVQQIIKEVAISSSHSAKVFLLTLNQAVYDHLDYFDTNSSICYYNGTAVSWWTRNRAISYQPNKAVSVVSADGKAVEVLANNTATYVRPALILPSDYEIVIKR